MNYEGLMLAELKIDPARSNITMTSKLKAVTSLQKIISYRAKPISQQEATQTKEE